MEVFRVFRTFTLILFSVLLAGPLSQSKAVAQSGEDAALQTDLSRVVQLQVGLQDRAAANSLLDFRYHILPAKTDAARGVARSGPSPLLPPAARDSKAAIRTSKTSLPKSGGFYPADLSYFGGAIITSATHNNVYFNRSDGSSWGDPATFLNDLGASQFIHLTDPYVGSKANGRYPVSTQFTANSSLCSAPTFCSANDILGIAHATAAALGGNTGYGHIIHIFLPQGVDTCMDPSNTQCYSPDNFSTWVFCAYHNSVVFNDIGKVLYTVEPFQQVQGCATPDLLLNDSTNSTLSHEAFETITDPDGDAWIAANSDIEDGYEIGDLCQSFLYGTFVMNGRSYQLQFEYSNKYHACAGGP